MSTRYLSSFIAIVLASVPAWAGETEDNDGHEVSARQVILRVNGPTAAVLQQLRQLGDSDDLRALSPSLNLYLLHSRSGNVKALLNILKNHPAVAFVEPDYILKHVATPNDPAFPQEWALLNASMPGADIGATNAWAISTGSTVNVVGIVDTGVDYTHPDLAANIWSAPSAFTVNLSWGPLTCPAGSHGYNAIAHSCDPRDDNSHGTHVSGTIGAVGNNGTGVTGVNWTTRIMGLKFMDSTGSGSTSAAIDAMEFALQAKAIFGAGANVRAFSNSYGGGGYSQAFLAEINKANTAEALFVAAAGNSSSNNDTTPFYPASFVAPNVIAVAATTSTDTLYSPASFSLDLSFRDANAHQAALYLLDFNGKARTQRVDVLDANNNVLDSRNVAGFGGGQYLVWNLTGHVILRITNTNSATNAVISGLFFR